MASKIFFLLALGFAVVLLITSEVAVAEDLASHHDSEVDSRGGYNRGERGGQGVYNSGGHEGHGIGDGRVVFGGSSAGCGRTIGGGHKGHGNCHGRYGGGRRCRFGCCSKSTSCKCCSSFEEASAYKQTQN